MGTGGAGPDRPRSAAAGSGRPPARGAACCGTTTGGWPASPGAAPRRLGATISATAAAALSWMFAEWLGRGKPTILGAARGAVAGLVAITPASGFVAPLPALAIGAGAGVLCYGACNLKTVLGWYDDALDGVWVPGAGRTLG